MRHGRLDLCVGVRDVDDHHSLFARPCRDHRAFVRRGEEARVVAHLVRFKALPLDLQLRRGDEGRTGPTTAFDSHTMEPFR